MSGGVHLRDLTTEQHSSKETSQRWRAAGDTVSDLTGLGMDPQTLRVHSGVFNHSKQLVSLFCKKVLSVWSE